MNKNQPGSKPEETDRDSHTTDAELNTNKQDRAGDFGNSGQFAPGGYYNQQGAAKPDRVDLDEELAPRRQLGNRQ
ncbi:MAG: hypothetical protein JWM21_2745 [Acidobacteria bacterium]|nr:hypothetical protein [Acidobacteriota bacterium]